MEQLLNWVKGILGCLLVMSLILQSTPGKQYHPYLRLFMGIILILTVLSPITDLAGMEQSLENLMDSLAFQEDRELEDKLLQGEEWAKEQIIEKAEEIAEEANALQEQQSQTQSAGTQDFQENWEQPSSDSAGIQIEVKVEVEKVEQIKPIGESGGE